MRLVHAQIRTVPESNTNVSISENQNEVRRETTQKIFARGRGKSIRYRDMLARELLEQARSILVTSLNDDYGRHPFSQLGSATKSVQSITIKTSNITQN